MSNGMKVITVHDKDFTFHRVNAGASFDVDLSAVGAYIVHPTSGAGSVSLGSANATTGLKTVTLTGGAGVHFVVVNHGGSVFTPEDIT